MLALQMADVKAQQDPMYTQYMHNPQTINPAYVGSNEMLSFMMLNREQWVGLDGAPKSRTFSMNAKLNYFRVGTGFSFINDELGPIQQNSFYADFAYHLRINEVSHLSFGLKAGFDMMQVNLMSVKLNQFNDDAFESNFNQDFILNFGFGAYWYNPRYYLGLAIPRMLQNKYDDNTVSTSKVGYKERHYFFTGGYIYPINRNVKLRPSILSKIVFNAPISIDLSLQCILQDKIWIGASHRFGDSMSFMLQYQVADRWRIGYSFDMTESELRKYNSGTHEIMLAFDIRLKNKKIMTPRYF